MKGHPTYYMLSDDELWERIKKLENREFETIAFGKIHRIKKVFDNRIEVEDTVQAIYKNSEYGILDAYHQLFKIGKICNKDYNSLAVGILLEAMSEQIEKWEENGETGLRIKTFDWVHSNGISIKERPELFWELILACQHAIKKESINPILELIESWKETAEITSDKQLVKELKQAEKEYGAGDIIPWKKVKKELNL